MSDRRATDNPDPSSRAYPQRSIISAHAAVFRGDRVLLARRAHEPSRGRWSVPGGAVELGETIRDAARREIGEEVGWGYKAPKDGLREAIRKVMG